MIRFSQTVLISLLLVTSTRAAEPYDLNIQNFRPAMDARSMLTVERSRVLGTFEPTLFKLNQFNECSYPLCPDL